MGRPWVSIVLPVHNGMPFLREAVASLLNQTYPYFDVIAIDDGSTDNSREYLQSIKDPRFKVHFNMQNEGLVSTLNKGIRLSHGQYIARMDSDDVSAPERIEKQVKFLEDNTEFGVCGTQIEVFGILNDYRKHPVKHQEIADQFLTKGCVIAHPSIMFRAKIIKVLPSPYSEDFHCAEDYELWTRLILKTKFANIDETLLKYRTHDGQISQNRLSIQQKQSSLIKYQYLINSLSISGEEKLHSIRCLCGTEQGRDPSKVPLILNAVFSIIETNNQRKIFTKRNLKHWLLARWADYIFNNGFEIEAIKAVFNERRQFILLTDVRLYRLLAKLCWFGLKRFYSNIPSITCPEGYLMTLCGPTSIRIVSLAQAISHAHQFRRYLKILDLDRHSSLEDPFLAKNRIAINSIVQDTNPAVRTFPFSILSKLRGYRCIVRPRQNISNLTYFYSESSTPSEDSMALQTFFKKYDIFSGSVKPPSSHGIDEKCVVVFISKEMMAIASKDEYRMTQILELLSIRLSNIIKESLVAPQIVLVIDDETSSSFFRKKFEFLSVTSALDFNTDDIGHLSFLRKLSNVVLHDDDPFYSIVSGPKGSTESLEC